MKQDVEIQQIIKFIQTYDKILIATHNNPDGDAIGSVVALETVLKKLNKDVFILFQNKIPKNYQDIVGLNRINKTNIPSKRYDLLIIVDCSDKNRLYDNILNCAEHIIVIDHHFESNHNLNNVEFIYNKNISSTGMIIYQLIKQIEQQYNILLMDNFISTCIYLTIVADTNNFKNNNVTYLTHQVASDMLKYNANTNLINNIYENREYSLLKLIANCFYRICIDYKYNLLYLVVKRDDISKANSTYKEACMLIDYIKNINKIDTYLLFIEDKDSVKVRARSNIIDVANILKEFNGGGHKFAAGASIYGDIYSVSNKVISKIKSTVNKTT